MESASSIFRKTFNCDELVDYLIINPGETDKFDLGKLARHHWCRLIIAHPEFIDLCDVSTDFIGDMSASIIAEHPQLFHRLPSPGRNWHIVLERQPQLISECPAPEKIFSARWVMILIEQPQLAPYCPWDKFRNEDWAVLLTHQIGFADRCPWERVSFFPYRTNDPEASWQLKYPLWNLCLHAHKEVVLKHRPDWKLHLDHPLDAERKSELLCIDPELAETIDMSCFRKTEWLRILTWQPQLISKCKVNRTFRKVPIRLVMAQPSLADSFSWHNASLFAESVSVGEFYRKCPELVPRVLGSLDWFEWMCLVRRHPEYLLRSRRYTLSFRDNARVFNEGVFSFAETGLDAICNAVWQFFPTYPPPESMLGGFDEDMSIHEFLIKSIMDTATARRFLKRQLYFTRWEFISELVELDCELLHRIIPESKMPFLWVVSAPERLWQIYLDRAGDVSGIADRNGNTLLHAALLRELFENTYDTVAGLQPEGVRYLLKRGCDPDKKNRSGYSYNDLLKIIRGKFEEPVQKLGFTEYNKYGENDYGC